MTECAMQYEEMRKKGQRFIDQVRKEPLADTGFVNKKVLNISYAEGSEKRKMDIYLPNDKNMPFPVIIDIFGGGFYFGKRSSYKMNLALELLKRGYAVVSIDYSLSKEAIFPTQIYEVKAAIRYVRNHAKEYGLDSDRIALLGESAGAFLGALTATSTGTGVFEDIRFGEEGSTEIKCMIALYCPTDLGITRAQFDVLALDTWVPELGAEDSPEGIFLGNKVSEIPRLVEMANPETYITERVPAFQFFHGLDDRVVPFLQSLNFAVKLVRAAGKEKVEHYLIPGAGHNQQHFMNEENYKKMETFLKRHMG